MKRGLVIGIIFVLLIGLFCCVARYRDRKVTDGTNSETDNILYGEYFGGGEDWKIVLEVGEVSPKGAFLEEIYLGESKQYKIYVEEKYCLQKKVKDRWENLDYCNDKIVWNAEIIPLQANGKNKWEISWGEVYGALQGGTYKIIKNLFFLVDNEIVNTEKIGVEFQIEE